MSKFNDYKLWLHEITRGTSNFLTLVEDVHCKKKFKVVNYFTRKVNEQFTTLKELHKWIIQLEDKLIKNKEV